MSNHWGASVNFEIGSNFIQHCRVGCLCLNELTGNLVNSLRGKFLLQNFIVANAR